MLCPVEAYINWITVAGLAKGPVFRRLDRWGNLADKAIEPHSLIAHSTPSGHPVHQHPATYSTL
ncbi:hypothetical protein PSA5_00060, partial [Pseudomonas syringae pv. actinidiae]